MRFLITLLLLISALETVHAKERPKYRCRDFVRDFMSAPSGSQIDGLKDPYISRSMGMIYGAYHALTGVPYDANDQSGLADFERRVAGECSARPDDRVPYVILEVAAALRKQLLDKTTSDQAISITADDWQAAQEIGQILGSAEGCGYQLDSKKVGDLMKNTIANITVDNRRTLSVAAAARDQELERMSDIERSASCELHRALAERYDLTP